jgi:Arc/MetJ family transcription regulator
MFAFLLDTHKYAILTHRRFAMRTNIDIDDRLMRQAMRRSGAPTKKAAVEAGLRLLADTHAQGSIRRLRGKVDWEGDTNQSRQARVPV